MAIDSAEKRRSAAAVGFAQNNPTVTPNQLKDAEWRSQVAHLFSGSAAEAVSLALARRFTVPRRPLVFQVTRPTLS